MKTVKKSKRGWIVSDDGICAGFRCMVQGNVFGRKILYTWDALNKMDEQGLNGAEHKSPDDVIDLQIGEKTTLAAQLIAMAAIYDGPGVIVLRRGNRVQ